MTAWSQNSLDKMLILIRTLFRNDIFPDVLNYSHIDSSDAFETPLVRYAS